MNAKSIVAASLAISLMGVVTTTANARENRTFVVNNEEVGVPVFPYDITDRPYEVIGEVTAGVRKATIFSKEASQEKIYKELWERADKLGADAVIKVNYGDSHVSAFSWGKTNATGTAIKFKPVNDATASAAATPPAAR